MSASLLSHICPQTVSDSARQESRNRELRLPPVQVYRWWARRTAAVTGALIDAAQAHWGHPPTVLDPFAGGGTIPFVAIERGCRVQAGDINPWAVWGLRTALSLPPPSDVAAGLSRLHRRASQLLAAAYRTTHKGRPADIAHTMRVAVAPCSRCGEMARLFPHALVSLLRRRDHGPGPAWLACPAGHLFMGDPTKTQPCPDCQRHTDPTARYLPRRTVRCLSCNHTEQLADRVGAQWTWDVVLVERICAGKRHLCRPSRAEVQQADGSRWQPRTPLGPIPTGKETRVLLRHGFRTWSDLYPRRQRVVLEGLLALCSTEVERAAVLGVTEMAGLLSRWDRYYLKSIEGMAGHRFNFTTLPVESNVWGVGRTGRGTLQRRMIGLQKASSWLHDQPSPQAQVFCQDAAKPPLQNVDLILTDPPYFDDVHYDELSLPLRAWAGLSTTPLHGEAVADPADLHDHTANLHRIFSGLRQALSPEGHLVFSYANRKPDAWMCLFSALEQAGFTGVGYATVHSENERDHAKRGTRAHHLDLILDLTAHDHPSAHHPPHRAPPVAHTDEEAFLRLAGEAALLLGQSPWKAALHQALTRHPFRHAGAK